MGCSNDHFIHRGRRDGQLHVVSRIRRNLSRRWVHRVRYPGEDFPNIVIATNDQIPARGVEPPRVERFLTLYDGRTFEQIWRTKLSEVNGTETHYHCTGRPILSTTIDNKWIVTAGTENPLILDSATGQARNIDGADTASAAGNYVATTTFDGISDYKPLSVLIPDTLATVRTQHRDDALVEWGIIDRGRNSAIDDRRVLISANRNFGVLDIPTGSVIRSEVRHEPSGTAFAPDVNTLYTPEERGLTAIDLDTLQTVWHIDVDGDGGVCGGVGDRVVVSVNRQLALLDATTGRQIQYVTTPDSCGTWRGNFLYVEEGSETLIYQVFQ